MKNRHDRSAPARWGPAVLMVIIGIIAPTAPVFGAAAIWLNNLDIGNPIYYLRAGTLADAGCYVEVLGGPDAEHLQPIVTKTVPDTEQAVFALQDGFFDHGFGLVPGVRDETDGCFQVIAWEGERTVNGWQTAQLRVVSPVWWNRTGNSNPPALAEPGTLLCPANLVIQPVVGPHPYPRLEISRAAGQLTISWPASYAGFTLEYSDAIPGANWISVAEVPVIVGDQNVVTTSVTNSARYFRLRK